MHAIFESLVLPVLHSLDSLSSLSFVLYNVCMSLSIFNKRYTSVTVLARVDLPLASLGSTSWLAAYLLEPIHHKNHAGFIIYMVLYSYKIFQHPRGVLGGGGGVGETQSDMQCHITMLLS